MRTIVKGNLGVAKIIADLTEKGLSLSVPLNEGARYDLVADDGTNLLKVQCKYTESDGEVIVVRPRSVTHTGYQDVATHKYTKDDVDLLAVYDATTDSCFYIPSEELGEGMGMFSLRLSPAKNGQEKGIRWAKEYMGL